MRQLIGRVLRDLNITNIVNAENGQDAFQKLKYEIKPDVILCDLEMPVMNGFEFISSLRNSDNVDQKDIPVLVLTGRKEEGNVREAIKLGVHGYLAKPISKLALESKLVFALTSPMIDPSVLD